MREMQIIECGCEWNKPSCEKGQQLFRVYRETVARQNTEKMYAGRAWDNHYWGIDEERDIQISPLTDGSGYGIDRINPHTHEWEPLIEITDPETYLNLHGYTTRVTQLAENDKFQGWWRR